MLQARVRALYDVPDNKSLIFYDYDLGNSSSRQARKDNESMVAKQIVSRCSTTTIRRKLDACQCRCGSRAVPFVSPRWKGFAGEKLCVAIASSAHHVCA